MDWVRIRCSTVSCTSLSQVNIWLLVIFLNGWRYESHTRSYRGCTQGFRGHLIKIFSADQVSFGPHGLLLSWSINIPFESFPLFLLLMARLSLSSVLQYRSEITASPFNSSQLISTDPISSKKKLGFTFQGSTAVTRFLNLGSRNDSTHWSSFWRQDWSCVTKSYHNHVYVLQSLQWDLWPQ